MGWKPRELSGLEVSTARWEKLGVKPQPTLAANEENI